MSIESAASPARLPATPCSPQCLLPKSEPLFDVPFPLVCGPLDDPEYIEDRAFLEARFPSEPRMLRVQGISELVASADWKFNTELFAAGFAIVTTGT
jgi:hypothetical protein